MWHVRAIDTDGKVMGIFPNFRTSEAALYFANDGVQGSDWPKAEIYKGLDKVATITK